MINLYDIAYGIGVGASSPYWLVKPSARRKVLGALGRETGADQRRDASKPAVMVHAVSLGEMNATRTLLKMLQIVRPDLQFIVSTTTETGFERGQSLYGSLPTAAVVRYPLDFSGTVDRVLDALRPEVVALMELELWPNFLRACEKRGIPVVLINGRMSGYSYGRYKWIAPIARTMIRRLSKICVQEQAYADRFIELGADPEKVVVTGTMKFDTPPIVDRVAGDDQLATAVGLWPGAEPIWVAGSTGPGEEEMILRQYRHLLTRFSRLRLVIVPRHDYRFDEVAALIESMKFRCVRRTQGMGALHAPGAIPPVVLGDTMGELRKFYSLASIAFVGRSLVDLGSRQHGSDMIEPAALARPILVGPYTGNFAEPMRKFKAAEAILEVPDERSLGESMAVLLSTPLEAAAMARRAREVVRREQGATERNMRVIVSQLKKDDKVTR